MPSMAWFSIAAAREGERNALAGRRIGSGEKERKELREVSPRSGWVVESKGVVKNKGAWSGAAVCDYHC